MCMCVDIFICAFVFIATKHVRVCGCVCVCVCVCVNQAYHTKLPSVDILYLSTFIDIFLLLLVYYACTYNFNGYVVQ